MKNSIKKLHEAVNGLNLGYKGNVSVNYHEYGIRLHVIIFSSSYETIYHEMKYIDGELSFDQSEQVLEKEVNKAITFINSIHD